MLSVLWTFLGPIPVSATALLTSSPPAYLSHALPPLPQFSDLFLAPLEKLAGLLRN